MTRPCYVSMFVRLAHQHSATRAIGHVLLTVLMVCGLTLPLAAAKLLATLSSDSPLPSLTTINVSAYVHHSLTSTVMILTTTVLQYVVVADLQTPLTACAKQVVFLSSSTTSVVFTNVLMDISLRLTVTVSSQQAAMPTPMVIILRLNALALVHHGPTLTQFLDTVLRYVLMVVGVTTMSVSLHVRLQAPLLPTSLSSASLPAPITLMPRADTVLPTVRTLPTKMTKLVPALPRVQVASGLTPPLNAVFTTAPQDGIDKKPALNLGSVCGKTKAVVPCLQTQ